MCGIFGYIGSKDPAISCLKGLEKLEYRGYDSAGLCGIHDQKLKAWKEVGKVSALEKAWEEDPSQISLAIAHTRWATHGAPTKDNAHPHFDEHLHIAVVHNGIIENHAALREMLKKQGAKFYSQTDTEVIAQLISHFYQGDLGMATQKALSLMEGFWALAVIHKDHPHQIVAAAKENPIAIGIHTENQEVFLSSDANAFYTPDLDVIFLQSHELAIIEAHKVEVFDSTQSVIIKEAEKILIDDTVRSKGAFEHFMLKEIFDQPEALQHALHGRLLEKLGSVEFENFKLTADDLSSIQKVLILGCGTSWHAGLIASSLIEELAHVPCQVEIASEFRYRNPVVTENTLVIAISQSGETLDTVAAVREMKKKGVKVVAVCNVANSTLTREADTTIFLRAGAEISVCSTKAFTSQITVLSLFALLLGRHKDVSQEEGILFLSEIKKLPSLVEEVLSKELHIQTIAEKYAKYSNFFFLGRHYMFSTSLEAALKLKEISYLNATGYPAGELKHGPIALVDDQLPIIGLCGNQKTLGKMMSNMMEIEARGAPLVLFTFAGSEEEHTLTEDVITLPVCIDELAPVPFSVALQLFAYHIAKCRGTEIDQPRNLAKSVTVE
ncbi:MAG: glutamine--fructose-6-phosphate transaminase (isomerizing) [Candidatus Rhabdochlamydia sp.]